MITTAPLLALALFASDAGLAAGPERPYILALGRNTGTDTLQTLRYADDDALAISALLPPAGEPHPVHVMVDDETSSRFAGVHGAVRAPTRAALLQSVQTLRRRVLADVEAGRAPEVLIWLSGHGTLDEDGHGFIPLGEERLSSRDLLEQVIEPLAPAHRIHLVVDTCFAGALVKVRAETQSIAPEQAEAAFAGQSWGKYPNLGLLVGSSSSTEAFEWERIRGGVFSALVRSAMQGLGDANGDGAISYRELDAFLAAATRGLEGTSAAPRYFVRSPAVDPQAVFSSRAWLGQTVSVDLDEAAREPFMIYDQQGHFRAGGNVEPGAAMRLWLPQGTEFYLRSAAGERRIDTTLAVAALADVDPGAVSRGNLDEILQRGLFATSFGPQFFGGFAARLPSTPQVGAVTNPVASSEGPGVGSYVAFGAGAGLAAVAALGALASGVGLIVFFSTDRQLPALAALGAIGAGALVLVVAAPLAATSAAVGWLLTE